MDAIRPLYEQYGVEAYYREHANDYANPHSPQIDELIRRNAHRLGNGPFLDFAAGGGEVSMALTASGKEAITGADPFTADLYVKNTGLPCLSISFADVIRGGLQDQTFQCIVSSFALHLCPAKDLFPLCFNLLSCAPLLIVITPHKRPALEHWPEFRLRWTDHALTEKGKKVFMKAYELDHYGI